MAEFSSVESRAFTADAGFGRRYDEPSQTDVSHRNVPSSIGMVAKQSVNRSPSTTKVGVPQGVLETLEVPAYHDWKRFWEVPIALILAGPALLMTGLLIWLVRATSPGPGIYAQERSGRNGKSFKMYKLRSMYIDAEARGAQWCAGDNDPRVTPVGKWLRKLHLDELPQIVNVLRGDMSFCGPRPERPQFIEKLVESVPYYKSRLTVRPGITGFAQINLPPDSGVESVLKKQTLDLEYVVKASMVYDLKMIACTALRLVGVPGGRATELARLKMTPEDSRFSVIYAPYWEAEAAKDQSTLAVALTPDLVACSKA